MEVTYKGPGESVEMDGMSFRKGARVQVTSDQYARMLTSDPAAEVELHSTRSDTAADVQKIRDGQVRERERVIKAAVREAETPAEADAARAQAAPAKKKGE